MQEKSIILPCENCTYMCVMYRLGENYSVQRRHTAYMLSYSLHNKFKIAGQTFGCV